MLLQMNNVLKHCKCNCKLLSCITVFELRLPCMYKVNAIFIFLALICHFMYLSKCFSAVSVCGTDKCCNYE